MPQVRRAMVVVGTDGFVDYVQVPDGQRFNLGPVSVLRLMMALVPMRNVRASLDEFLEKKQVMLSVDLDRMWAMLPFHRARYSSTNPLMGREDRKPETSSVRQGTTMAENMSDKSMTEAISNQVARIEAEISVLQQHAKDAGSGSLSKSMMDSQIASLKELITTIRSPSPYGSQTKNKDFYVKASESSYDTFVANTAMAEEIVAKVAATDEAIERLASAGKKFNSVRAKADLHKIASRVASIAQDVDFSQPWISADLSALVKQASEIHGLFVTKEV
jgi:hypothetical protein